MRRSRVKDEVLTGFNRHGNVDTEKKKKRFSPLDRVFCSGGKLKLKSVDTNVYYIFMTTFFGEKQVKARYRKESAVQTPESKHI